MTAFDVSAATIVNASVKPVRSAISALRVAAASTPPAKTNGATPAGKSNGSEATFSPAKIPTGRERSHAYARWSGTRNAGSRTAGTGAGTGKASGKSIGRGGGR